MPKKKSEPNPTPTPTPKIDWNGSLADFKEVTMNAQPTATVGNVKPGGTKVSNPSKGADTGIFAGSGTPLGTSLAGTKTNARSIIGAASIATGAGSLGKLAATMAASKVTSMAVLNAKAEARVQSGFRSQPPSRPVKYEPLMPKKTENVPSMTREDVDAIMYDTMSRGAKSSAEQKIYAAKRDAILESKYPTVSRMEQFRQSEKNWQQVVNKKIPPPRIK